MMKTFVLSAAPEEAFLEFHTLVKVVLIYKNKTRPYIILLLIPP